MTRTTALTLWVGILLCIVVLISFSSVLFVSDPLNSPLAHNFWWPVACTTRGCITSSTWQNLHQLQTAFAQTNAENPASPQQTLTTLIRQHLVQHALLTSPVTINDAKKYRVEILHLSDDSNIKALTGLTAHEYDEQVLLPFLKQEALRQQLKVESVDELYIQLSTQRRIWILPIGLWWDYEKGMVQSR